MKHPSIEKAFIDADFLLQSNDPRSALVALNKVLMAHPKDPDALYMMGVALARMELYAVAAPVLQLCVAERPDFWQAWNNLGNCFNEQHPRAALKYYKHAMKLTNGEAWEPVSNAANAASGCGRYAEAVDLGEKALAIKPDSQDAHNVLGLARLHLGDWKRGWRSYSRSYGNKWRTARDYTPDGPTPFWLPSVASYEDVVVIHGEQGPGDEFMFGTLIPRALDAAAEAGARIIIDCHPQTETLFRETFGDHDAVLGVFGTRQQDMVSWPHDLGVTVTHKLPFGHLPLHFLDYEDGEPSFRDPAYLKLPAGIEGAGKGLLKGRRGKMAVGLAWNGGSLETGWSRRSLTPEEVHYIVSSLPETDFFILEYQNQERPLADAIAAHGPLPNAHDLKLHKYNNDLALLAGVVSALDHIASVTTTVVDLAGALGKRATVLAPTAPDWRYSEAAGEDRMFWYPQHHIIRQKEEGSWKPEIEKLIETLRSFQSLRG